MKKITLLCMLLVASFGFAQENCAGVLDLGTLTSPYMGDTTGAVNDFVQDCLTNASAPDQVYSILVPDTFTLSIGQTANNYDSKVRLAYGAACPGDMLIDCNDDPDIETLMWVNTTGADQTVYWTQSAFNSGSGTFTLAWSVDAPPACSEPVEVTATAVDVSVDLSWTAAVSGPTGYNWEIQPDGVAQGTMGAVASGSTAMTMATATGLTISTPYDAFVQTVCGVDGTSAWVGPISFTTNPVPPPANDDFANAIAVVCDANYISDTSFATLDEDDAPDGFGADNDGQNVWYSYTGSGVEEEVTIDLCASGYDTTFLIYTGMSGSLSIVAGNDDNAAICSTGFQSYGSFISDGTTTYWICINGFDPGDVGPVDMTVTCASPVSAPANDDCMAAEVLTLGVAVTGTNVGATQSVADQPSCDLFGSISDVWYAVVAPVTGELKISTVIGTADQANIAIYDDCAGLAANEIAESCSNGNGGEEVTVTGLTSGTTYYVRIWNNGNSINSRIEGDFTVLAEDAALSVGNNVFEGFKYFPNPVNPVSGALSLRAQNNIENVSVYNMLGQEVVRSTPNALVDEVDMSNLQTGAYFVKVTINGATETVRIVKQ